MPDDGPTIPTHAEEVALAPRAQRSEWHPRGGRAHQPHARGHPRRHLGPLSVGHTARGRPGARRDRELLLDGWRRRHVRGSVRGRVQVPRRHAGLTRSPRRPTERSGRWGATTATTAASIASRSTSRIAAPWTRVVQGTPRPARGGLSRPRQGSADPGSAMRIAVPDPGRPSPSRRAPGSPPRLELKPGPRTATATAGRVPRPGQRKAGGTSHGEGVPTARPRSPVVAKPAHGGPRGGTRPRRRGREVPEGGRRPRREVGPGQCSTS